MPFCIVCPSWFVPVRPLRASELVSANDVSLFTYLIEDIFSGHRIDLKGTAENKRGIPISMPIFQLYIRICMLFPRQLTPEKLRYGNYMKLIRWRSSGMRNWDCDPLAREKCDAWVQDIISALIFRYCSDIVMPYSIVAVHGLGAIPDWAWIWKREATMSEEEIHINWLRDEDILPSKITHARIMTFSYESTWHKDAPRQWQSFCVNQLLTALDNQRKQVSANNISILTWLIRLHPQQEATSEYHPVIFIAYSFGGIVIEQVQIMYIWGRAYPDS